VADSPYAVPGIGADFNSYYLNSTPDAAFWNYLGQQGLGSGNRPVDTYARNQQSRIYSQYQAQAGSNPLQGFYDYLQQNKPDLQGQFMDQSPDQRGDTSNRFLTPRARFVNAY
jgi:hypothetical protein